MLVFTVHMGILCIGFLLLPASFVRFFGFATPDPLWIRIFAIILGVLVFYFAMAIREEATREKKKLSKMEVEI